MRLIISAAVIVAGCLSLTGTSSLAQEIPQDDGGPERGPRATVRPGLELPPGYELRTGEELPPAKAEGPGLTLAKLESLAWGNNPTLVQARTHVQGAAGKAFQAGLYPNPRMGFEAEQIGVEDTPGEFYGGFVEQEIVTGGKLNLSRDKYRRRAGAARLQAEAQTRRVINDVRIHFFRALGAAQLVELQRELLKNAEDNLVTTREMFNVGQANRADVHQANVALQRSRLDLKMAENELDMQREMLAAVIGVPLGHGPLAGVLECGNGPIEWHAALRRLLAESPELGMARAKLRADEVTLRRERVEPIPNVVIRGAVGHNYEAEETVAAAGASIEVPLFDRNQGTIRQAQADLVRQRAEIRRTELILQRRLAEQYRHYLTAFQHVRDYRELVLPEARRAYELRLESYKANRQAWPQVLDAQRGYFELRTDYIRNLVALREAEVAIDGLLLTDGLMAPPGVTPPGHIDAVPKPR